MGNWGWAAARNRCSQSPRIKTEHRSPIELWWCPAGTAGPLTNVPLPRPPMQRGPRVLASRRSAGCELAHSRRGKPRRGVDVAAHGTEPPGVRRVRLGTATFRVAMQSTIFLTAVCAGVALVGCAQIKGSDGAATATQTPPSPPSTYTNKETYAHAASDVSTTALIAGGVTSGGAAVAPSATAIEGRLKEWHLLPADIADDLRAGRPITRTRPLSAADDNPMADEALLTLINNRLVADADTGRVTTQLKIAHGELTIRGAASSEGLIGRVIAVALDTNGVTQVTSELKIDRRLPPALRDAPAPMGTTSGKE